MANVHWLLNTAESLKVKKDHYILGNEACHCPSTGYMGRDLLVAWARAERYAHTILADLAAGSNGMYLSNKKLILVYVHGWIIISQMAIFNVNS